MPELPEVETVVRDLCALNFVGTTIEQVEVLWPKSIASSNPDIFCKQVQAQKIVRIHRRGKFIVLDLSQQGHIAIHLRMSGRLAAISTDLPLQKHDRVVFTLSAEWQLRFHDTRKFGRIAFVQDLQQFFAALGPEPLDSAFTLQDFQERLKHKKSKIKSVLLDQNFLAGLGNIYVDEALWLAKIHPERAACDVSCEESALLLASVRHVLQSSIDAKGTSLGKGKGNFHSISQNYGENQTLLQVYRRHRSPCSRCQKMIERIVVAQRGTHFCPFCQVQ